MSLCTRLISLGLSFFLIFFIFSVAFVLEPAFASTTWNHTWHDVNIKPEEMCASIKLLNAYSHGSSFSLTQLEVFSISWPGGHRRCRCPRIVSLPSCRDRRQTSETPHRWDNWQAVSDTYQIYRSINRLQTFLQADILFAALLQPQQRWTEPHWSLSEPSGCAEAAAVLTRSSSWSRSRSVCCQWSGSWKTWPCRCSSRLCCGTSWACGSQTSEKTQAERHTYTQTHIPSDHEEPCGNI